ncbi:zinc finger BED domain-containing protein 4-like [Perca flavescens]|uniref:zinc finger BED domain-containing protein 4-like n=1 Tax=Perca flavescens TaxID=8167 RepID=UPI00106EEE15|nr:zinc finger BED domain-containing protein 4-like [Perca flavescens]
MEPVAKIGRSEMWEHFDLISPNKVQCLICDQKLAYNNNTSSMLRHFRAKHDRATATAQAESSSQGNRKDRIDEALVHMVVKDSQPFSIVDDVGFRAFVSLLDPSYILPSRQTVKAMVESKFVEERQKAKDELLNATAVSLTSDMWTSIHMDAYLAITCHYINADDKLSTILLSVGKFPERHTAANIAATKTSVMEEWGIQGKVRCLVTDGAANMLACGNILQLRHSICIAHAINLLVKKAIDQTPGLEEIRGKARKIAAYFRTSTVARERLLSIQQQMGIPVHKLVQEVETRWNSTYEMMARLYEQREPVSAAMVSLSTDLAALTPAEYHNIAECLGPLSPLKEAMVELSSEKTVSGSKIVPLVRMLRHAINTKLREVNGEMAKELCTNLMRLMMERLSHYETASQHSLATLLDPRFKAVGFCNPGNSQNAIRRLTAECSFLFKDSSTPPDPAAQEPAESSGTGLWDLLDLHVSETRKVKSATANATVEVQRYLSEPNIQRSEDPLQFWAQHKHVYPHLYVLARNILCTPASSVPYVLIEY